MSAHDEHEHPSVPLESIDFAAEKPVHVFVIKSNLTSKTMVEKLIPDELKATFNSDKVPQALRDKLESMLAARGVVNNYVSLMLTVDSAGIFRAYTTQANEKISGEKIERRRAEGERGLCREMSTEDECQDEDMIRRNLMMNETMFELRQAAGDWQGEVELSKAFEGENAMQDARDAIGAEMFDVLYPAAPAVVSPIQSAELEKAKPLTKARRAVLVEKFGEKAIEELETRIHGKSKGHD